MVPENVVVRKTYSCGKYAFTHGHRKVNTKKQIIVIGHNQPHVLFRDEMKARYTEPVWVKGPLRKPYKNKGIIIMPAFNELSGATLVNRNMLLGPIAKCLDKKRAHCYLLDGTDLGVISDLWLK
jgi:metallophosphoesterase superfamily enzyme